MTGRGAASLRDLRRLGEITAVVVVTWLLLGWYFGYPIQQADGTVFVAPYTQSQLGAGFDWTQHLYRIGVLGGAPMHDYAGTLPLVQLCSLLGLSTTPTLVVQILFLQICIGFFGVTMMTSLAATWLGRTIELRASERIASMLLCSFAPLLAWRIGLGHDNIVEGLLPWLVACALICAARAGTTSGVALVLGWFAVWNGLSGIGSQLVVYSVVFGAPIAVVLLLDVVRDREARRRLALVTVVLVSAVLVTLPRLAGMLAYASSGDASRTLGERVAYAFGEARWIDWLGSLPWTSSFARGELHHEVNYPIGPLLCFAVLLWSRGRARRFAWAMLASAVLAMLFAGNVAPVSNALFTLVPPLESFRVPARAILPVLLLLPSAALAAWWTAREQARDIATEPARAPLVGWLAVASAGGIIALHGAIPVSIREALAWLVALAVAALVRWRPALAQRYALAALIAPLAALGVLAFDERIPTQLATDRIEDGPRELRAAVLAEAPELAMPLNRLAIVNAPAPYRISLAFAAGLSSLDGDFNPPRRFVDLLGALRGRPLPQGTVVFELAQKPSFAILQRLYNVRHALVFGGEGPSLQPIEGALGAAWLPRRVHVEPDLATIARELWAHKDALAEDAWVLASDLVPPSVCDGRVTGATTDALGQRVRVDVDTGTPCTLVLAMNYVSSLRASTAEQLSLHTFPIDIALTGVAVPAGRTTVTVAPVAHVPSWTRVAWLVGLVFLAGALAAQALLRQRIE